MIPMKDMTACSCGRVESPDKRSAHFAGICSKLVPGPWRCVRSRAGGAIWFSFAGQVESSLPVAFYQLPCRDRGRVESGSPPAGPRAPVQARLQLTAVLQKNFMKILLSASLI